MGTRFGWPTTGFTMATKYEQRTRTVQEAAILNNFKIIRQIRLLQQEQQILL